MRNKTKFIVLLLVAVLGITSLTACNQEPKEYKSAELNCVIGGENYTYEVVYDDNYKVISSTDNIEWFNENIDAKEYKDDALQLIAYIEVEVANAGGTVTHKPIKTVTR